MLRMCIVGSQYVKSQLKSKLDNCIEYIKRGFFNPNLYKIFMTNWSKLLDFLEVLILWSRPVCCLCAPNCDLLGSRSYYVLRYPLYWMNLGIGRLFCVKTLERALTSLFPVVWNTNMVLCRIMLC
jgi:hypothetical protein